MSLAEKKETAEQLRGELAALRVEREHALHSSNAVLQEAKLDDEIDRLQREVELARAQRDAAVNGGSVEDALEAMRLAAATQVDNGSVDLATPAEVTPTPDSTTSPDVAPTETDPQVDLFSAMPPLGEPTTDAPKAEGE